jgi:hypothetical protein
VPFDWYYPRPELASSYLEEFSRRGARALTVFAERGLGKTAFLHRDLTPQAVLRNRLPVYVDVWAVRTDPAAAGGYRVPRVSASDIHAAHSRLDPDG